MILLLLYWAQYFFLHSLLAANAVKYWVQNISSVSGQTYRLAYNLFNLVGLVVLVGFHLSVECPSFYNSTATVLVAGLICTLAGLALMIQSTREYHLPSFLGLSKETNMPLQVKGLHKYMRHPLYSGTLLFFTGICIAFPLYKNWYVLLIMIVYLFIGMWLEERKLLVVFGDEYRLYQQKVKRLIPGIV
jgi:protein-S-isoprenylcysteine O-methyltransferase Ste14